MPPVVVITAFGSDELHERAEQTGAAAVLDKPFDLAELTALGRRLVSVHATCIPRRGPKHSAFPAQP